MTPHSQPGFDENSAFGVLAAVCVVLAVVAVGILFLAAFSYGVA